ncbi:ChaN family lipoprotein [Streptomyces sp. TRM66268-LWL]|uniref:ChaN family lipoprotein n=1 Tax=Streptomyces polyasparticus TaxID=2767826 RepID=A0ABR7SKJ9_9ACTN|nr:ChaN family lipoprotein [Streptomyces polyasparticus]MBC9715389.1 ChaN family lipoprotein [Streptomyces polyasparticus]
MKDESSKVRRLSRRAVLAATGAGAAVAAAGVGSAAATEAAERGGRFVEGVLRAFARHRVVAVGEVHGQQEHHDALLMLLADPRFAGVVDDIVVEFGNALYQPVMDRFVQGGAVEDRELRPVWRNTTQSPMATWDAPMYEQFFRTVRAVNWPLPADRRIRVLLGDPPVDWSRVTTRGDVHTAFGDRDGHMASVVLREVLAKRRRVLVCYGSRHVMHALPGEQGGGGIAQIEQRTGERAYVILAGGHERLASLPGRSLLPARGTWLRGADTSEFRYLPGECGVPFGAVADALLYLGHVGAQTQSLPNPAIYLDPAYWAELERRKRIMGTPIDLVKQYRQEQSVVWPTPPAPEC